MQDKVYREHASLIEHRASETPKQQEDFLYLAVSQGDQEFPFLIVTQYYAPGPDAGFSPGVLLLPETSLLFVGAGERLLAYQLDRPAKLWEDRADLGFWGWKRYKDVLLMSAELELAGWNIRGEKLWSTFVEPPWDYRLDEKTIHIEVMGTVASFPLYEGPPNGYRWSHGMRNEVEISEQKDDLLKGKEKRLKRQRSIKETQSGGTVSMKKRSEGRGLVITQRQGGQIQS